jgi:DNA polymerase I
MAENLLFDSSEIGDPDINLTIPEWIRTKHFKRCESIDELRAFVDEAIQIGLCALDIETEGLDSRVYPNPDTGRFETVHKIVGFCLCKDDKGAIYIPVRHKNGSAYNLDVTEVEKEIGRLARGAILIFHNAKFDQEFLEFMGEPCQVDDNKRFEDTMIADYLEYPFKKYHGLKALSKEEIGLVMIELHNLFPPKTKKIDFSLLSPTGLGVTEYGCSDAYCTRQLWVAKYAKLMKENELIYLMEKRVVPALRRSERMRIKIDKNLIAELRKEVVVARDESIRKMNEIVKPYLKNDETVVDYNSPKQMADLLYKRMGIPADEDIVKIGKSEQISTDAETLDKITAAYSGKYPILDMILEYRSLDGSLPKYFDNFLNNTDANDEGRLGFMACRADTGRLSCPDNKAEDGFLGVNIHSIPKAKGDGPITSKRLREAIVARPGYAMLKVDFSGEELRIITNLSKEPKWVNEFNAGSGDLHTLMSMELFGAADETNRGKAKGANFALIYGGGPSALQRYTKLERHECQRIVDKFFISLSVLKRWIDGQKKKISAGAVIKTALGRRFKIPEDTNMNDRSVKAFWERKAVNSPIQGTGADIIKYAMGKLDRIFVKEGWYPDIARILINVHDELVVEIKLDYLEKIVPVVCKTMCSFSSIPQLGWVVPLEVEPLIGKSWAAKGNWYKMKSGKEPIPEWLQPYIKADAPKEGTQNSEALDIPVSKVETVEVNPSNVVVIPEVYNYAIRSPLSEKTRINLNNICKWSQIPTVAPAKTLLIVSTIGGEKILDETLDVRVDILKFMVLADIFGL